MIAAKMATLKRGSNQHSPNCEPSRDDAAQLLSVSPRAVDRAKHVLEHGSKALIDAVDRIRQQARKGDQPGASKEKLPDLEKGQARDQAGKAFGVSGVFAPFTSSKRPFPDNANKSQENPQGF